MYSYFRRDFNLSSYKLDDVAGEFISDTIKKIDYDEEKDQTYLYSSNLAGLNVGDYVHIEITNFSSDYYNGGEKFQVFDIQTDVEKNGKTFNVIIIKGKHELDMNFKLKWTMAKDDVSPQDIFRLSNGNSSERAIVAKYCIQDCNLVHHLMNKIDVLTGYIEMSSICSVPISFLVFRGQGIKLTSYVAKKCREKNTLMPELQKSRDGGGYEGAVQRHSIGPNVCVDDHERCGFADHGVLHCGGDGAGGRIGPIKWDHSKRHSQRIHGAQHLHLSAYTEHAYHFGHIRIYQRTHAEIQQHFHFWISHAGSRCTRRYRDGLHPL